MARASTSTLLSLDRYAQMLGLSPVHFAGATGSTIFPLFGRCKDLWPQYSWQSNDDLISREELALLIHTAEEDIKQALGYAVAPEWEDSEVHAYPMAAYGIAPAVPTTWGKVIAPGRRAVAEIETDAAVVYSDPDGDTWDELATITVATDLTDANQCKLYFAGHGGEPEWEIRPVKSKVIAAGTLTITAPSWLFIDPDLWEAYPTSAEFTGIDISTTANYVTTVDVYREYIDSTLASAEFLWEGSNRDARIAFVSQCCGGVGCPQCELTTQDGCLTVRNAETGIMTPWAASYSDGVWSADSFTLCRAPQMVKFHYYAGAISDKYLAGRSFDPLSDYLAEAVMWLATARMDRPLCSCSNVQNRAAELARDLTASSRDRFYVRYQNMSIFNNPFGTRSGEVKAWDRVSRLMGDQIWSAVAL